ncbi:Peptidase M12B ADAM/reprolysin [Penicillium hispanicum]|uniref:Peptidase M12B ADAM/reprolysin n=1 Tax=Penicillium hispanicum TaxID=1080232 RepID=UPI002541BF76|nr:Peptidase M12B ADAM/reprolysin [Penicillium hispanicum]KAJ5585253.1 Peptidase M12B ADAM/reprolysin [Penicillium hispanicum]
MKFLGLYFKLLFTIACVVPTWAATNALHLINPVISDPTATIFNITVEIEKHEQKLRFHLETNQDLIPPDAEIHYSDLHGKKNDNDNLPGSKVRFTRGSAWTQHTPGDGWQNVGWARLAVSQGDIILLDGTFSLIHVQYKIRLEDDGNGSTRMTAHEIEPFSPFANQSSIHPICSVAPRHSRNKRQGWNAWENNDLIANIGSTYGCPDTRQIAYIGIMTDCTFTASFNSSDAARRYILNMVNTASVVFENSFNISLSIRNLTLSDAECPTSGSSTATEWNMPCSQGDLNSRLRDFSLWRDGVSDNNAYWTLLTGCSVAAGEVGVSWVGALCSSGSGYSSGQASANVVALTQTEWQVFA